MKNNIKSNPVIKLNYKQIYILKNHDYHLGKY